MSTPSAAEVASSAPRPTAPQPSRMRFDTSDVKSSYCNVCNASSTREEVVLTLGINQDWDLDRNKDVQIKLLHRIILSPFAAKRLNEMLANLMREYEARYGDLK
jgi:Protein of unknown function (DUF3467)